MQVVGLSRDPHGQVWATIGGGVPYDLPAEDVPRAALLRFVASRRGVASVGAMALGSLGVAGELEQAGVAKVRAWIGELNRLASNAGRHADQLRDLGRRARAIETSPALSADFVRRAYERSVASVFDAMAERAAQRRKDAMRVRDWIYSAAQTLYEVTGADPLEVGERPGAIGAIGALGGVVVPLGVAAILGGLGLAGYIAHLVAEDAKEARYIEYKAQLVERAEAATDPVVKKALLDELGKDILAGERAAKEMPWWAKLALGAGALIGGGLLIKRVSR